MTATIDPLPGRPWSAQAVLGDAMNRVSGPDTPILVAWIDEEGELRYATSKMTNAQLCWLGARLLQSGANGEAIA